jgi:hypothetical protein
MREKLEGNHQSQMMVFTDRSVLVYEDSIWWQLQVDGGEMGGGAAVFVPQQNYFFGGGSPHLGAQGNVSERDRNSFLPALDLGR